MLLTYLERVKWHSFVSIHDWHHKMPGRIKASKVYSRYWEFPGGPVVRIPSFHSNWLGVGGGHRFHPWSGNYILQTVWHIKKKWSIPGAGSRETFSTLCYHLDNLTVYLKKKANYFQKTKKCLEYQVQYSDMFSHLQGWTSYMSLWGYSSVQLLSRVWLFATPRTAAHQSSLSITNSQSLLKLMSIASVIPSNHLILCHPLLSPSIFPSIRVCSSESVLLIRWPKYWSFSISPSNEHSGLISFRMDWLDLLAVQGILESFPVP